MSLKASEKYEEYKEKLGVSIYAQNRGYTGMHKMCKDIAKIYLDQYFELVELELNNKYPIIAQANDKLDKTK
jgi:hypothetical protein